MANWNRFGVRFLAMCQILSGLGWGLHKLTDSNSMKLLGLFTLGGVALWIYLVVLSALWFISGIGMWRFVERWRKVSISLYFWVAFDFLCAAIQITLVQPASFLMLAPSWKAFLTGYLLVALFAGGCALFLIRQKPVFDKVSR